MENVRTPTWSMVPALFGFVLGGSMGVVPGLLLVWLVMSFEWPRTRDDLRVELGIAAFTFGIVVTGAAGAWAARRLWWLSRTMS